MESDTPFLLSLMNLEFNGKYAAFYNDTTLQKDLRNFGMVRYIPQELAGIYHT